MFKNLTVGKKIAFGFTAVLALTATLGIVSWLQITRVKTGVTDLADTHMALTDALNEIDAAATDQCLETFRYAVQKDDSRLSELQTDSDTVDKNAEAAAKVIASDAELVVAGWSKQLDEIKAAHDEFEKGCQALVAVVKGANSTAEQIKTAVDAMEAKYNPFMAQVDSLLKSNDEEANRVSTAAVKSAAQGTLVIMVLGFTALLIGSALAFFIARGITSVLQRIVNSLTEGSEQVASASGQVSSASQSLAEGATEQAAGLEETSSSLEEMSSMTKQNADNAQQANTLAAEARKAAATGADSMGRMNQAILDIQKSSDETAKIIKVIDEIAFQTNLLALNAAVEAARAGEAGKGFAVVAEEVRNLAMRSAEAAKNTARMIEESVKNSKNGVDIANEVGKVLEEIVGSVGKTTDLVSEIAAASQEQAQGIDQVNTAVAQMDKVTQQNAANAEESASASEELSAQAESMNVIVGELVALVGGAGLKAAQSGGPKKTEHHLHADLQHKAPRIEKAVSKSHGFGRSDEAFHKIASHPQAKHTPAAKAIPLDKSEHDLESFNN